MSVLCLGGFAGGGALVPALAAPAIERPNVLWITCEDMGPFLGCYGDRYARTPNLDALARESVRYTNAFAYSGVCAPSRSCLITGVYPTRLGSHPMRSTTRLPEAVKCFPEYLRAAGYYASNNAKTDYNFAVPPAAWDESGNQGHWRRRPPGQPFFAVFNFTSTHQSGVFGDDARRATVQARLAPGQAHDDSAAPIPPIHPDTPEFRREWAWYYDNVSRMDAQAGEVLRQLEADGLADDTIVFFFSDHGTGMPGIKMWTWDASLRVPLLVRFPPKWRHLASAASGATTDRLVSFVDFAPTVLNLCNVELPAHLQGTVFLGRAAGPPRRYAFGGKDRQAERHDTVRFAHDGRFHYLRNFQPHLPWGQFVSYNNQHASLRAWERLHVEGKLSGPSARFFESKPLEELYDVRSDPWETTNLAADPRYIKELERLRGQCLGWMLRTGDLGFLPEHELHRRAEGSTPFEIALDPEKNPLQQLLSAAETANRADPSNVPALVELLDSPDAALRWWGALGLVALKDKAAPATAALRNALKDESPDVRVAAAEALANIGEDKEALDQLVAELEHESVFVRLAALNTLDRMGARAAPALAAIRAAPTDDPLHRDVADYVRRIAGYLPDRIGR